MEKNIYRLVGIKPISFQLPLKETFVKKFVEENGQKKDKGFRRIKYVPGTDSIFAEDIQGDLQPQQIWFDNGDVVAYKDDKLLNEIMTQHPWFGKKYILWSQDKEDEQKLSLQRAKASARQLIDDADKYKIKAIALAVKGPQAINWTDNKCELELREYADTDPKELQKAMDGSDYQAKVLAGLAFVKNLVKENPGQTAVVWSDSEGVILKLAKGENGIRELGRFLSNVTPESKLVLQSIAERLEAIDTNTAKEESKESDKDAEIARLKAELEKHKSKGEKQKELTEVQKARSEYKSLYKADVPNNMKNNLVWMNNRILEKKEEDQTE